uniref:Amidase domain-containing protein n=1 Tax=Palpitomonas bilix TaxID=652834 RepID=A0A7S3D435_9EUKA|mmetsp:Transcript_21071/g.54765  ORF Transcript_21071/g.54765 Transcript_21071/m.54765 type:complete len:589 (+) Transcript_21071:248-2014(+)|eukprot:CAMPEP_0113880162 /NCGR_PEP_ID=MMETSP0780_2-20120614/7633_1 /TAXON_ID=652834 /ORGANISM="Palpitomonas bilix" /LENGTH=588 /DNA_ID=CAMNT_0000866809 /DNA_START=241 /DNA_END=2007 /DNA_ORIENTATION=+ /assembly_acc=CAM_ASM_000599
MEDEIEVTDTSTLKDKLWASAAEMGYSYLYTAMRFGVSVLTRVGLIEAEVSETGELLLSIQDLVYVIVMYCLVLVVVQRIIFRKTGALLAIFSLVSSQKDYDKKLRKDQLAEIKKDIKQAMGEDGEDGESDRPSPRSSLRPSKHAKRNWTREAIMSSLTKVNGLVKKNGQSAAEVLARTHFDQALNISAKHALAEGEAERLGGAPLAVCESLSASVKKGVQKASVAFACIRYIGSILSIETRTTRGNLPLTLPGEGRKAVKGVWLDDDEKRKVVGNLSAGYGCVLAVRKDVCPVGLMADTLGGGLVTSSLVGVFGFKPSSGRVSNSGMDVPLPVLPYTAPMLVARTSDSMSVVARYFLSGVMSTVDPSVAPIGLRTRAESTSLAGKSVVVVANGVNGAEEEVKNEVKKAGAKLLDVDLTTEIKEMALLRCALCIHTGDFEAELHGEDVRCSVEEELKRGKKSGEFGPDVNAAKKMGKKSVPEMQQRLRRLRERVTALLVLREVDVIMYAGEIEDGITTSITSPSKYTLLSSCLAMCGWGGMVAPLRAKPSQAKATLAAWSMPFQDELLLAVANFNSIVKEGISIDDEE